MLKKAYLEITNVCNLDCSFCHGTKRQKRFMNTDEFLRAAGKIRKHTKYLYLHVMGEPLLHPELENFLKIAHELDFLVNITTNGTLLSQKREILLSSDAIRKVSISLHSHEANLSALTLDEYLNTCLSFCNDASNKGIISVMRLWNKGGMESNNDEILAKMRAFFKGEWQENQKGYKLKDNLFLEWGDKFDWPDEDIAPISDDHSCYGLRDQIGVLADGSVVPCCLDAEGSITLGNIFSEDLDDILTSKRALDLKRSFENRRICEPLCLRCGFAATKFKNN